MHAQQGWESSALTSAEYYLRQKPLAPQRSTIKFSRIILAFLGHDAANLHLGSALRLNTAGAEKMLTAYMVDHPTSYLTETAFFDAANFYFNQGRYSYALKWYSKISEREVAKVQRPEYNFKKGYSYFVSKRYKNAKPILKK